MAIQSIPVHPNPVMENLAKHIEYNKYELHPFEIVMIIQSFTKVSYQRACTAYGMLQERLSYLIPSQYTISEIELLREPYLSLFEKFDLVIEHVGYKPVTPENIAFWNKVISTPGWDGKDL